MILKNAAKLYKLAGPIIHATRNPTEDALREAAEAAQKFTSGEPIGPLQISEPPPVLSALFALAAKVFSAVADFRLTPEEMQEIAVAAAVLVWAIKGK